MNNFKLISISNSRELNKYINDSCWNCSVLLPYYQERYACFSYNKDYSFEVLIDLFLYGNDSDQIGAISLIAEKFPYELYKFISDDKKYIPLNKLKFLLNIVIPSYLPLILPK